MRTIIAIIVCLTGLASLWIWQSTHRDVPASSTRSTSSSSASDSIAAGSMAFPSSVMAQQRDRGRGGQGPGQGPGKVPAQAQALAVVAGLVVDLVVAVVVVAFAVNDGKSIAASSHNGRSRRASNTMCSRSREFATRRVAPMVGAIDGAMTSPIAIGTFRFACKI